MNNQGYSHRANALAAYRQPHHHKFEHREHSSTLLGQAQAITDPTPLDVISGRGQGVQRHQGNIKYRQLVFVNKVLYAKCPKCDKVKISKGIVAAVREVGGRFLELDERTRAYADIGDKRATEKTSQALREGQTKIRQQMLRDGSMPAKGDQHEISADGYFGYSVQILHSFIDEEKNCRLNIGTVPLPQQAPPSPPSVDFQQKLAAAEGLVAIRIPAGFGAASASTDTATAATERVPGTAQAEMVPIPQAKKLDRSDSAKARAKARAKAAAMAMAMDQFPGADHEEAPPCSPKTRPCSPELPQNSIGRFSGEAGGHLSLGRLTSMSLGSVFSAHSASRVLGTFRVDEANKADSRCSFESVTTEIQDLMRMSGPRLTQVSDMGEEGLMDEGRMGYVDREVAILDEGGAKEDRVSELRFTDQSAAIGYGGDPVARWTDYTECTSYSKTSLMDASVMTIAMEDMSIQDGPPAAA